MLLSRLPLAVGPVECQSEEECVPTYQYACTACGEQLEAVQKFSDESLTECPECTGQLRKVFSAVGIVFKGSGFYRTDNRASSSSSATTTAGSSGSSGSSGDSAKKESTSAPAKTESTASSTSTPASATSAA